MINTDNGGNTQDGKHFGNHSACVFGYVSNVSEYQLYDDWDYSTHYFTYGNWSQVSFNTVIPY